VTSDERRASSASVDKTLRIWDLESGESLRTLEGHTQGHCRGCDLRRAPRRLGVVGQNAADLDLESGESLRTLEGHTLSLGR
jgi:hypothetical protein